MSFIGERKGKLGLTKEPTEEPLDLKAIYEKVKSKKKREQEK